MPREGAKGLGVDDLSLGVGENKEGWTYIVASKHANDFAAAVELDEEPLVEVLYRSRS